MHHPEPNVLRRILDEEETDGDVLREYILGAANNISELEISGRRDDTGPWFEIIQAGLNNDACPPDVHEELLARENKRIQILSVDSYTCPVEALLTVIKAGIVDPALMTAAISNRSLPIEQILAHTSRSILCHPRILRGHAAERLAHDPGCPPDILRAIVKNVIESGKPHRYLIGVARNHQCPTDVIASFLSPPMTQILPENLLCSIYKAIANHPNATVDLRASAALALMDIDG